MPDTGRERCGRAFASVALEISKGFINTEYACMRPAQINVQVPCYLQASAARADRMQIVGCANHAIRSRSCACQSRSTENDVSARVCGNYAADLTNVERLNSFFKRLLHLTMRELTEVTADLK